ncbi:MAG: hypothetical protein AAF690_14490 [Acidobacteriota bacterium]
MKALYTSALLLLLFAPAATLAETAEERDARFSAMIEGAEMLGEFNVVAADGTVSKPQTDEYAVSKLERGDDGTWVFHYTMSYGGGNKATLPIPVTVEWSGDTPVLTMTEQELPGLGTFSVRVLLYDGLYAGTWRAIGGFGGHMWGRIVKPSAADDAEN